MTNLRIVARGLLVATIAMISCRATSSDQLAAAGTRISTPEAGEPLRVISQRAGATLWRGIERPGSQITSLVYRVESRDVLRDRRAAIRRASLARDGSLLLLEATPLSRTGDLVRITPADAQPTFNYMIRVQRVRTTGGRSRSDLLQSATIPGVPGELDDGQIVLPVTSKGSEPRHALITLSPELNAAATVPLYPRDMDPAFEAHQAVASHNGRAIVVLYVAPPRPAQPGIVPTVLVVHDPTSGFERWSVSIDVPRECDEEGLTILSAFRTDSWLQEGPDHHVTVVIGAAAVEIDPNGDAASFRVRPSRHDVAGCEPLVRAVAR